MKSFSELTQSETPTLVDFYADWCAPCKQMVPILQQVGVQFEDKVKVIKVDTDKNQSAATHYQIKSIPTMLLFKNGEIVWRHSGTIPLQTLAAVLEQHIVSA